MTEPLSSYSPFAWFYEKYWGVEIPFQLMTAIDKLLLPRLREGSSILDLCCGTGQIAAELVARRFKVTGIDGSEAMLDFARRRAPSAKFLLADARTFDLPPVHDAVVSTFDSLNHIMCLDELTNVFSNVHAALNDGGYFLFDVNTERGFILHWRDYFAIVESDHVCVLLGDYNPIDKIGRYDITMFRREHSVWQRTAATITERCYTVREIRSALRTAGFIDVSRHDADTELGLVDHIGRTFFLARK